MLLKFLALLQIITLIVVQQKFVVCHLRSQLDNVPSDKKLFRTTQDNKIIYMFANFIQVSRYDCLSTSCIVVFSNKGTCLRAFLLLFTCKSQRLAESASYFFDRANIGDNVEGTTGWSSGRYTPEQKTVGSEAHIDEESQSKTVKKRKRTTVSMLFEQAAWASIKI